MVLSEYVPTWDNVHAKAGLYARDFAAAVAWEQAKDFYEMSVAGESLGHYIQMSLPRTSGR